MKFGYQCENCKSLHSKKINIWWCPVCGCETCETCFDKYMVCKSCSKNHTDEECLKIAYDTYGEFEEEYLMLQENK